MTQAAASMVCQHHEQQRQSVDARRTAASAPAVTFVAAALQPVHRSRRVRFHHFQWEAMQL